MALFQKKPAVSDSAPAYTIGSQKTKLIVGLGNPGPEHKSSRHNTGYQVLEWFAKSNEFPDWIKKRDLHCELTQLNMGPNRVILCKPTNYMNNSGQVVSNIQRYYQIYNSDTLIVYDELALGFGVIRCRSGGSDAGHNGVKSLISHIGENFNRIRIGVGSVQQNQDQVKFVLSSFSKAERPHLNKLWQEASSLITEYIYSSQLPHDTRSIH